MKARFYAVVHLLYAMIDRRYAVLLRFAKAQTEMVMLRDQKKHYILSPEERQRLLSLGAEINHDIKDALVIVSWQTILLSGPFDTLCNHRLMTASRIFTLTPTHLAATYYQWFVSSLTACGQGRQGRENPG